MTQGNVNNVFQVNIIIMSIPKEEKRKNDSQDNFLHCDLLLKITSFSMNSKKS